MRIGLYFFSALILMGMIGAYIHTLNLGNYVQKILGIDVNLPVSAWFVLPMAILLFFTLLHMTYYSLKNFFTKKKWKKDAETLNDAMYWSLLKEPKEHKYLTKEIRSSAKLLGKSTVNVTGSVEGISEKFSDVLALIKDIERGEYIDLKERGLAKKLSKNNPIYIQNNLNRLDDDPKFIEEVLQSNESYNDETIHKALNLFASQETFFKAKKYVKLFDIDNFFVMLERAVEGEDIGMNEEMIRFFVSELPFGCVEYIHLARVTVKKFSPDTNLAMFKEFSKDDEHASQAYLYLLFEYEMLDAIQEYLDEHDENEFIRFRALYTLKRANSKYNVNGLVNSFAVCNDN